MKIVPLLGRILFALIFVMSGLNHVMGAGADYAAAAGVPAARIMVPFAGLLALLGGLSILLGYKVKYGAWLVVIFLVPVSIALHNFWSVTDPMQKQMQMAMFMKNMAILGGALLLAYFGPGPYSLDKQKV
ncbi:DoxX family protein [Chitinophaga polysaccharea]|uniref:DoxX family membrane protein n=1 Tax=Chitinophaga TaxID=79328 RepID=UPI0014552BF4|nr:MULTISPECIES: DoxX family protein [Chitinophaga]NLR59042.1 DoxX family protein [Chitinophaga polysaccharea]NLU92187.1 DoxX family protein [Chitinophaga sp. Ak27]